MASRTEKELRSEMDKLRAEITAFTGRIVVSDNIQYLRIRAGEIRRRKRNGDTPSSANLLDKSSVISISTTRRRAELLARICKERKTGASTIMREAFDAWASTNGFSVEMKHIKRFDRPEAP